MNAFRLNVVIPENDFWLFGRPSGRLHESSLVLRSPLDVTGAQFWSRSEDPDLTASANLKPMVRHPGSLWGS